MTGLYPLFVSKLFTIIENKIHDSILILKRNTRLIRFKKQFISFYIVYYWNNLNTCLYNSYCDIKYYMAIKAKHANKSCSTSLNLLQIKASHDVISWIQNNCRENNWLTQKFVNRQERLSSSKDTVFPYLTDWWF